MLRQLEISAITFHDDECWYFFSQINHLYHKNLRTGELKDCGTVPWENEGAEQLYAGMEYIDGKIYLLPYVARSIAVYDTKENKYSQIKPDEDLIRDKKYLFRACFTSGKIVYAFGIHARTIIAIDSENNSIRYINGWNKDVEKLLSKPYGILSRKQIAFHDGIAFLPLYYGDALLAFDYRKESTEIIRLNRGAKGYWGIYCYDDEMWITDRNDYLIGLDCKDMSIKELYELKQTADNIDEYIIVSKEGPQIYTADSDKALTTNKEICIVEGKYDCICSNLLYTAFWLYDKRCVVLFDGRSAVNLDLPIEIDDYVCRQFYTDRGCIKEAAGFGLAEYLSDIYML